MDTARSSLPIIIPDQPANTTEITTVNQAAAVSTPFRIAIVWMMINGRFDSNTNKTRLFTGTVGYVNQGFDLFEHFERYLHSMGGAGGWCCQL